MSRSGWRHPFLERPWMDVRAFLAQVNWPDGDDGCLFAIIDSVLATKADRYLALTTSMHDLIVTLKPVSDPPLDVIAVRAPSSLRFPSEGMVRIEYLSGLRGNTDIQRPERDAVPLFWRFVDTAFGIRPSDAPNPIARSRPA